MRLKVAMRLPSGRRELVVTSQSGEALQEDRAAWLRDNPSIPLLRLSFERGRDGAGATIRYDVEGYTPASSYLAHQKLGYEELLGMLVDLQVALDVSSTRHCPIEALVFDPAFVFVDGSGGLHFACVPLTDLPLDATNSPLTLLRVLGDPSKLHLVGEDARALSKRVGDFVHGLGGIFSANAYRHLMDGERSDKTMVGRPFADQAGAGFAARMGTVSAAPRARHDAWTPLDDVRTTQQAYLVRTSTGESWPLAQGMPVTIGRGVQADVQMLGNPRISRVHARVSCSGDVVVVQDLHSANGTGVEGRAIAPGGSGQTKVGRMFYVGDEALTVQLGPSRNG